MIENIPIILKSIINSNADTIIDLCPGSGKYGLLAKEYSCPSRLDALKLNTFIEEDCVQRKIYNNIFDMQVNSISENFWSQYDLVLANNIIEYLPIDLAKLLISDILQNKCKLILSTPKSNMWTDLDNQIKPKDIVSHWDWTMLPAPSKDISTLYSLIYYYE